MRPSRTPPPTLETSWPSRGLAPGREPAGGTVAPRTQRRRRRLSARAERLSQLWRSVVPPITVRTVFVPPPLIVVAFHQPLVRPVRGLVAPRAAFAPVPGVDPPSVAVTRLLPAAGHPGPAVVLPVPVSPDPHGIAMR